MFSLRTFGWRTFLTRTAKNWLGGSCVLKRTSPPHLCRLGMLMVHRGLAVDHSHRDIMHVVWPLPHWRASEIAFIPYLAIWFAEINWLKHIHLHICSAVLGSHDICYGILSNEYIEHKAAKDTQCTCSRLYCWRWITWLTGKTRMNMEGILRLLNLLKE